MKQRGKKTERIKRNDHLRDLWDNVKHPNIWIMSPRTQKESAGVQPQQDPGVPSGWTTLARGEGREERISSVQFSSVAQSCLTLCDPMDSSLSGSSLHGILQARVLEWVAISFSRGSSRPRDRTRVSCIPGRCFNLWATMPNLGPFLLCFCLNLPQDLWI